MQLCPPCLSVTFVQLFIWSNVCPRCVHFIIFVQLYICPTIQRRASIAEQRTTTASPPFTGSRVNPLCSRTPRTPLTSATPAMPPAFPLCTASTHAQSPPQTTLSPLTRAPPACHTTTINSAYTMGRWITRAVRQPCRPNCTHTQSHLQTAVTAARAVAACTVLPARPQRFLPASRMTLLVLPLQKMPRSPPLWACPLSDHPLQAEGHEQHIRPSKLPAESLPA